MNEILNQLVDRIEALDTTSKIEAINHIKQRLHSISPFSAEPVDCVLWVKHEEIEANDYNPNSVAPPEMKLLELSIVSDGYTQPIVAWEQIENGSRFEVVDGFHRTRVGKECSSVKARLFGYVPVSVIKGDRVERNDRIASTIRHNRARGKHAVTAMSDIVVELKRRNWSDKKIGKELGMDPDEVLRLSQISGLAEMFSDCAFTEAWDSEDIFEGDTDVIAVD